MCLKKVPRNEMTKERWRGGDGGTLRGGDSMEDEDVPLVDGVFEGALGALALEIEALVDAMEDLNAQLQEKVFANAALKNELRKLKEKNIVDTSVYIALGMFKLDIKPISPRLKNNRDSHESRQLAIHNRSLIRKHHNKTPYELLHDQKPDLSYLYVFGALCYHTNGGEDLAMASEQFSSGLGPKLLTPGTINSGLVPNIPSSTLCTINKYFKNTSRNTISADSSHVHSINQPPEHINKWTKDHPIDNVIGDPSRPVSTRQQLQDEFLFCYFDAFLSSVELNCYKDALMESCWIKDKQEELNEFERLEV
uniref:Integrase, catalytic region, zinc finger, CCHC-type, peptidase aspartic, catalytic n=1 Tax=Tanacetum cinerariifolium TaxID=118510 RepID=A0A6L2L218_TANCI|nr:hypothetical protein [Tanacetum cinerariifolium]